MAVGGDRNADARSADQNVPAFYSARQFAARQRTFPGYIDCTNERFVIMKRMLNLEFHEVDAARWGDFERLFESRGGPKSCWCMVWRAGAKTTKGPDRKAAIHAAYSPAICSRGRLPRSIPRSLASSSRDVVPRHRHDALALGELDLEIHHVLLAERHFRARQVKFPHPRKALVIEPHRLFPPRHEAFAPRLQRFRVVQPQDFDVADQQARRARSRGITSDRAGI